MSLRVDKPQFLAWRRPGHVSGSVLGAVDLLRRGGLHAGDDRYEFLCPALEDVDRDHGQSAAIFSASGNGGCRAAGEGVEVLRGPARFLARDLWRPCR